MKEHKWNCDVNKKKNMFYVLNYLMPNTTDGLKHIKARNSTD